MLHQGKAVCSCLSLFLLMLDTSHFHSGKLSFHQGHVRFSHLHHYSHPFQESPQPKESEPLWYQALHETWKIGSLCPRGFGGQIEIQACACRSWDFLCMAPYGLYFPLVPILKTSLMGLSHILLNLIGTFLKARYYSLTILHSQLKNFRLLPWCPASRSHRKTSLSMEGYAI